MVADLIRDSTLGQIINYASGGKYLSYADQRPDFVVPNHFLLPSDKRPSPTTYDSSDNTTVTDDLEKQKTLSGAVTPNTELKRESTITTDEKNEKEFGASVTSLPDPYIVGWYGDDDPDNPRLVFFLILGIRRID